MNNVDRLIATIGLTGILTVAVYLAVTLNLWDRLNNLPFYTLNALAFWFTVLNTLILLTGLGYLRRKIQDVTVFVFAVKGLEQGQQVTVKQDQPTLKMEDYPHA